MAKHLPLVTIAIPTYNRADRFLMQTLDSARHQSYPNVEVLVSDNCSTDNTRELVTGLADPRIRYLRHSENVGWLNNFRYCIKEARGDYFMLLCDDDLIDVDFVECCMLAVDYNLDVGVIRTGTRVINGNGSVVAEYANPVDGLSTPDLVLAWLGGKTAPYLCSTLYNTNRLRQVGGFEELYYHFNDVAAFFKVAGQFGRADVKEVKASYRMHAEELTYRANLGTWCDNSLELLRLLCSIAPEKKDTIRARGLPFLASLNYNRAMHWGSSVPQRIAAYLLVFGKFGYRYLPSRRHLSFSLSGRASF
jgi:glycosyltransferase involved in cell wall biosynthesis